VVEGVALAVRGDTFVTAQLLGRRGRPTGEAAKSKVVRRKNSPPWNLEFDFPEVKKSAEIEFIVYQTSKGRGDRKIGYARRKVGEIEPDNADVVELILLRPDDFAEASLPGVAGWGKIRVSFRYQLK
jgi:Ca2+-dependent lipid-binding protein